MDIQEYQHLQGEFLETKIRSLSRSAMDEQIRQFGGQYALLCQRLEALYAGDRENEFWTIRPGGLDEIDSAIERARSDNPKALPLLQSFRELNRVLLPFMDVYEEQVLSDVTHLSKDELDTLYANLSKPIASTKEIETKDPQNLRQAQNASGTLRLATLMTAAVRRELKDRFGSEPS